MTTASPNRSPLRFLPAPHPASPMLVLLVASLLVVTAMFLPFDVVTCWLHWSYASDGHSPWRIYLTRTDCNYPPFMLYLLTAQEALRRALGWNIADVNQLFLVKVPQILAHIAGGIASYFGLRRLFGETYARQACLIYALSPALFVNAALWGQVDALLALVMVATILLLMNDKPVLAGVVFGLALCIKLQAIIIAPAVVLYAWRRFGWAQSSKAMGAGILTIVAIAFPFAIAGAGRPLLQAYIGSAGYYPYASMNAYNFWGLSNCLTQWMHHLPYAISPQDNVALLGPLTAKHIGLLLYGSALAALLLKLYRTPTPRMLAWIAATTAFSFFMLCTQMHERYGVPAAALFALVAPESLAALIIFAGVNLCSGWNEWIILLLNWSMKYRVSSFLSAQLTLSDMSPAVVSLTNFLVYLGTLRHILRQNEQTESAITEPISLA